MRTVTKLLLAIALALTLSTPAAALITLSLSQVGGTCVANGPHSCVAAPDDTLVLDIQYSIGSGDSVVSISVTLAFDEAVKSFDPGASTETGFAAWSGGSYSLNNLATGDIGLNPLDPNEAVGWEKASTAPGGGTAPCVFGACTSMGTAAFVLSGLPGHIWFGFGTMVGDPTFMDISGNPALVSLGVFMIVPEPTTASLLGLGLVGLAAASRRRRR